MAAIRDGRVLDAAATASLLDFGRLVEAVERAAIERDAGEIACPDRQVVPLAGGATMLSMPAVAGDVAIHKLITVAPGNASRGLPTIHGTVTVFDPVTARPLLVLDGPTVTAMRTAAVSMSAWHRLAPADATRVLLIGTGVQSACHLRAIASLRPDCRVRVRGTSRERAIGFCDAHRGLAADLAPADDDDQPDVVITLTTSEVPVWREPARAGTLVIAVGSFRPHIAEIAAATVRGSAVVGRRSGRRAARGGRPDRRRHRLVRRRIARQPRAWRSAALGPRGALQERRLRGMGSRGGARRARGATLSAAMPRARGRARRSRSGLR